MPAASLRHFHLALSASVSLKPKLYIVECTTDIPVPYCKSLLKFSTVLKSKFAFDDSRLLWCLSKRRLQEARALVERVSHRDPHARVVRWTSLLCKYWRCGYVDEARLLFDLMPERNVVTYNAMLSGYVQSGRLNDACRFFEQMPHKNVVSWTSMLCGLADAGRIEDAKNFFGVMPERNIVSWNSMVAGLMRNYDLEGARKVFDETPGKNIVSYNAMIAGYAENYRMQEAKALFDELEDKNVITWTSMISGYCRAGNVDEGFSLFQKMPEKNVVSWTAMISGFAWNGLYEKALLVFLSMRTSDVRLNVDTFVSLVYTCSGLGLPRLGKQLHAQFIVTNQGYEDYDGRVNRSLVHMYSTQGVMDLALRIFETNLSSCNSQALNALINGFIQCGQLKMAEKMFGRISLRDNISWTCMIVGYFNAGQVSEACNLFSSMPDRDAIAWTAVISGHVQNELFGEAFFILSEMRSQDISPLNSTFSVLLGAAGAMACLDQGRQLHCLHLKMTSDYDMIVENSLVSMYAKCGSIGDAYSIFCYMPLRDIISWNSMIMGLASHGRAAESLLVYESLIESGTSPNSVTFLGILSACSHAGLVSEGLALFTSMNKDYAIQPGVEHYISIINLLGRAGMVKEAEELVSKLPLEPGQAIWGSLLGVCGLSKENVEVAKRAAQRLFELDSRNAPGHVVLCNLYAARGQRIQEIKLRKEMGTKGVIKAPGCSWMLLRRKVH